MADNKKAKRLSKEQIKNKLLDSMTIDEVVEMQDPEEAAKIIKWYEDIIKTKKKGL